MEQQRGMNIYATCPHCGARMNVINLERHQAKCLDGPHGEKVFSFIRSIAEDGVIPPMKIYDAKRPKELPNANVLTAWAGGWKQLAAHIGLAAKKQVRDYTPRPTRVELREQLVDTWCQAVIWYENRVRQRDAQQANSLIALHDWQTRTYTRGGRVYRESYTVLR